MPTERRRMTFSNAEVSNALISFYKKKEMPLPKSRDVIAAKIEEREDGSDVLLYHPKTEDTCLKTKPTILPINTAAAVLINFCMENNIPVPRRQKKALTVDGDNLVIVIRSDIAEEDEDTNIPI